MKRDFITLYEARSDGARGCHNCAHRYGGSSKFWHCTRVGRYVEVETRNGGKCSVGSELRLWSPRKGLLQRMFHYFVRGEK